MATLCSLSLAGQSNEGVADMLLITGGRFTTVTVVVAELLALVRSGTVVVPLAVLVIIVPLTIAQLTLTTSVTVANAPPRRSGKLTVRLLPVPPHTAPPVAEHDTNVVAAGRISERRILRAGGTPRLSSLIV